MPTRRLHYGILMIALAIGCDDATSPPTRLLAPLPRRTEEVTAPAPAPVWAQRVEGTDEGAKYVLLFPTAHWNGRLVLFVHGLVDPARPIALPSTGGFDPFGRSQYAVALSSFSENGWAVKDGAQRTHALRDIFTKQFGPPSRVYLYGQSMGSLIALKLAESFPTQYDGVFAECGILGGTLARMRYMFDVRSLFDYLYPGVLPGGTLAVPDDLQLTQAIRAPAHSAMVANIARARVLATFTQTPIPAKGDSELVMAIEDQLFRHAREVNDIMRRGHGEPPVGNRAIKYVGALDEGELELLNASVPRYDAGQYATHYAMQYYEPMGDLRVPVVTLYTPRDPALPASLSEELYQSRVDMHGQSAFLKRDSTATVKFGHCSGLFTDRQTAFRDLVSWVDRP